MRLASSCIIQESILGKGMVEGTLAMYVPGYMSEFPHADATHDKKFLFRF